MADAPSPYDLGAYVVDEHLRDQGVGIPKGVEYLPDRKWSGGMLADQPETLLQLGRCTIFQPEEAVRLHLLAKPGSLDRCKPVMAVVQQMEVVSILKIGRASCRDRG